MGGGGGCKKMKIKGNGSSKEGGVSKGAGGESFMFRAVAVVV
jgi:hypothetical protein